MVEYELLLFGINVILYRVPFPPCLFHFFSCLEHEVLSSSVSCSKSFPSILIFSSVFHLLHHFLCHPRFSGMLFQLIYVIVQNSQDIIFYRHGLHRYLPCLLCANLCTSISFLLVIKLSRFHLDLIHSIFILF